MPKYGSLLPRRWHMATKLQVTVYEKQRALETLISTSIVFLVVAPLMYGSLQLLGMSESMEPLLGTTIITATFAIAVLLSLKLGFVIEKRALRQLRKLTELAEYRLAEPQIQVRKLKNISDIVGISFMGGSVLAYHVNLIESLSWGSPFFLGVALQYIITPLFLATRPLVTVPDQPANG
jgi:hypothetical protein